jgi:hypothetical protein
VVSKNDLPTITFSDGVASVEIRAHVPEFYYNIYKYFSDVPWPLLVIIIGIVSIILASTIVLTFSMIAAIFAGKPISSVFETKPSAQPKVEQL